MIRVNMAHVLEGMGAGKDHIDEVAVVISTNGFLEHKIIVKLKADLPKDEIVFHESDMASLMDHISSIIGVGFHVYETHQTSAQQPKATITLKADTEGAGDNDKNIRLILNTISQYMSNKNYQ